MNLFEETRPLKIIHPIGGERVIAALFPSPDGLYFFDVGWYDPYGMNGNCIHFIEGEIEGDSPWIIKNNNEKTKIEVIKENDPLMNVALGWRKYMDTVKLKKSLHDIWFDTLTIGEREKISKWEKENKISS